MGTPVYAGGNGVIEYVGNNGGYGKYIRIRHNNEYKTAYAHLSGYKKGISKGIRVPRIEVIGYVEKHRKIYWTTFYALYFRINKLIHSN